MNDVRSRKHTCSLVRLVAGCVALACLALATSPALAKDAALKDNHALDQAVDAIIKEHGADLKFSLWLGPAEGEAWYQRNADAVLPTASSIKAFYLVLFFDRFKDQLDQPVPGAAKVLNDDNHPAISHFTPQQREDIRRELTTATVRQVGKIMIDSTITSNAVYNAAANLVTSVLGGPEAITQAIHRLDPAFKDVFARRYMLRERKPGDNEATAAAFAALYQRLATGKLAGIDEATLTAVRETLLTEKNAQRGTRYSKGGLLKSDPLTRVHAGWWDTPQGKFVYVVMTAKPIPENPGPSDTIEALSKTTTDLNQLLVDAARARLE